MGGRRPARKRRRGGGGWAQAPPEPGSRRVGGWAGVGRQPNMRPIYVLKKTLLASRQEEIEGQAQEGVGGRSSIVLRADGRVRRCTAGRAASRFLPEEIAAQPQSATMAIEKAASRRPINRSVFRPHFFAEPVGGWVGCEWVAGFVGGGVGGRAQGHTSGGWVGGSRARWSTNCPTGAKEQNPGSASTPRQL